MRGMPLRTNKITFNTIFSEAIRGEAERFHIITTLVQRIIYIFFVGLAPSLLTPDKIHSVTEKYPRLSPFLDNRNCDTMHAEQNSMGISFAEAPSLGAEFI